MPTSPIFLRLLILGLSLFTNSTFSQTVLWEETFSGDVFPNGWTTQSLNTTDVSWQITVNGMADQGLFWDNRPAIDSDSGGGAAVFDSDSASINGNIIPHHVELKSPKLGIPLNTRIAVNFNQYYRNLQSVTNIGVSIDDGLSWQDYQVNQGVGINVETSEDSEVFVEITDALVGSVDSIFIRFVFEGNKYFWIVDDVQLLKLPSDYGETFPPELGDSLTAWGLPYKVDALGGAYRPNEFIAKFLDSTPESVKDSIREEYNVISYDTCFCAGPELWLIPDSLNAQFGPNLINNPSFEADESLENDLTSSCACNADSYCFGTKMTDKCGTWSPNDFTAADGNSFLIVDGPVGSAATIWQQQVTVKKDSTYLFIFKVRNFQDLGLPLLGFLVDGVTIMSIQPEEVGNWGEYIFSWKYTSGSADKSVDLSLKQLNYGQSVMGFDYGLDDFYFGEVESAQLIDIEKEKKKLTEDSEVEAFDLNYYAFGDLEEQPQDTLGDISSPTSGEEPECDVLIAVLDTGIDYEYNTTNLDLKSFLWRNNNPQCFDTDVIGWNFVDNNNKPFDANGHGTHVAGIIAQGMLLPSQDQSCTAKLMPIASGDKHGILTLFRATCGVYYAAAHEAHLINASWGFYGFQADNDNDVLRNAIEYAGNQNNAILITSAGNQDVDLATHPHYPSNYSLSNILTVGSVNGLTLQKSTFSNYSSQFVDYHAYGEEIDSSLPSSLYDPDWQARDGTSMAAPAVTAALARILCAEESMSPDVLTSTLDCIGDLIDNGNIYTIIDPILTDSCVFENTDDEMYMDVEPSAVVHFGPNPATNTFWVNPDFEVESDLELYIFDALGSLVLHEKIDSVSPKQAVPIDVSSLSDGIYFLSFMHKGHQHSIRMIKQ